MALKLQLGRMQQIIRIEKLDELSVRLADTPISGRVRPKTGLSHQSDGRVRTKLCRDVVDNVLDPFGRAVIDHDNFEIVVRLEEA